MADIKRPDPHEPCVPDYRGYDVDPTTGQAINPFKLRDKKNKHTNPRRRNTLDTDAGERFWGID